MWLIWYIRNGILGIIVVTFCPTLFIFTYIYTEKKNSLQAYFEGRLNLFDFEKSANI